MNRAQKKLGAFQAVAGKAMKGLGLIFGTVAVGKLVKDTISTAMRTETLDIAMQSVAKSSGYAISTLQEQRKAVMELGIAQQEASQILTRFMQAQLDTADAAKLSRVAQDAAVIAGMNSSEAAEQMTEAIAKQRPQLLSAFGMTRNLNAIYDDYSKTLGKTRAQLSEAEKKQAMLNYILKEGEKIAGTYEASMGSVGKQIGSLPRYWQTLQNAIATPLALPGVSVAVETITNALKSAISWADANTISLQRWGQSVANVVRIAVKGFQLVTGAIAQNWAVIRFAATALATYALSTRAVAAATAAWRIATAMLKGELMTKIPVLTAVSAMIGNYRLQVALAPVATNIFTAALYRLQAALHSVQVAMGPIGWAMLGISVAVGVGTSLWSKYSQSLDKANQSLKDLGNLTSSQGKSASKAADAIQEQADAINEAGKAAKGNLQGFDEIHQMQEDTAAGGLDLFGDLDFEGLDAAIPAIDFDALAAGVEQVKPTLRGFFSWIGEQMGNVWETVKGKWQEFTTWVSGTWAGPLFVAIGTVVSTFAGIVSSAFQGLSTVAQWLWENVLVPLGSFIGGVLSAVFQALGDVAIWLWENALQPLGAIVKDVVSAAFEGLAKIAQWLWENVLQPLGSFIVDVLSVAFSGLAEIVKWLWENVLVPLGGFIVDTLVPVFAAIANVVGSVLQVAIEALIKVFEFLWYDVLKPIALWLGDTFGPVFEEMGKSIREIIDGLRTTFQGLIDFIVGVFTGDWKRAWEGVKQIFKGVFDSLWGIVKAPLNLIIDGINWVIGGLNKISFSLPSWIPGVGGRTFGINIPKIPKLATGGVVDSPTIAMIGEGRYPEAVVPLGRSPQMEDLVSQVAVAVQRDGTDDKGKTTGATHWPSFGSLGGGIKEIMQGLRSALDRLVRFASGDSAGNTETALSSAKQVITAAVDSFSAIVKTPLNLTVDITNRVASRLNKVHLEQPKWNVDGKSPGISIPKIPKLATGGITNGPMLAMVGDNPGGREVVAPLDDLIGMIKAALQEGSGSANLNLTVKIGEDTITEKVISNINRRSRINGETAIVV